MPTKTRGSRTRNHHASRKNPKLQDVSSELSLSHEREDDLIKSGAYRIGPGEVEECLLRHPAVAMAAVVGVPDAERGQVIKAFVRLASDQTPSLALAGELQAFVKERVGFHAYPRSIEFVDELPLTTTGKLQRFVLRQRTDPSDLRAD